MTRAELLAILTAYSDELSGIVSRFNKTQSGIWINRNDDPRFRQIGLELIDLLRDELVDGARLAVQMTHFLNESMKNYSSSPSLYGVENVLGLVKSVCTRVSRSSAAMASEARQSSEASRDLRIARLFQFGERFHLVARQLRQRRSGRPTLDVSDEYDVQDLLHALLRIEFDDVRPEQWTPEYAGGSARMDFLLPEIESVVETKMTRPTLTANRVGEELIIDVAKYGKHPSCRLLFCFVYDPGGYIANPRGLESDLNTLPAEIQVRVLIAQ